MNLFVYGTLKTNGRFWQTTLAPREGQPDSIKGFNLYDLGSFPAIVKAGRGKPVVRGEVFLDVPESLLPRLDAIEGVPHLYNREMIRTEGGHECWVYFMNAKPTYGTRIKSGEWIVEPPMSAEKRKAMKAALYGEDD